MQKITGIIPTFNEEKNIKEAIESLLWCDEIIVVDSYSKDKTQEIAKSFHNIKFFSHEYEHSAAQKNWIIPQVSHDWIFLLDADERPTTELVEEIKLIINSNSSEDAYWIYRRNHFMGKEIKYSGWQSDKVIRLFKRHCRYENKHVHAEIIGFNKIGILKNKLIHHTYTDLTTYLRKADRYTTWGAIDRFEKFKKNGKKIFKTN